MKKKIDEVGAPPVDEYLQMLVDGGANLYACKMSMDMMKLTKDDLIEGAEVLGAMEFMEITEHSQILLV